MKEEEFYVEIVKFITQALLGRINNQSQTLKIITIGVQAALKSNKNKK